MGTPSADEAIAQLRCAIDALCAVELYRLSEDDLLTLTRDVEVQRRRLPVLDHALIGELEARGVAEQRCRRSTATLLRGVLRLAPREAAARVRAAQRFGSGESVTGAPVPPRYPQVAAAQASGQLSAEHARVIAATIEDLPDAVRVEHGASVESRLVTEAAQFDPEILARLGRHLIDVLDPDGTLATDEENQRRRDAVLVGNRDGSGELHAHLTPPAFARWQAVLSPLAAPRPESAGQRDERTAGQRLHDALDTVAARLLRSGDLPASGGTPATVLLTMTLDQLEQRTGLVTTGHGGQLSVADALRVAGEAGIVPIVLDRTDGVLAYGRSRRCTSPGQRRALAARDGGCVFPGCDYPPDWCEAHHVCAWQDGGSTDLDNLALLCDFHHDHHERSGWRIVMTDGLPWCIPPPWIDPAQKPQRNALPTLEPVA